VGAFAVWRWLTRKPRREPAPDPADTLRAKLDESRALASEREVSDTQVDQADLDPDARRRTVHEQARARADELRGGGQE
jgi:hypothetical protein